MSETMKISSIRELTPNEICAVSGGDNDDENLGFGGWNYPYGNSSGGGSTNGGGSATNGGSTSMNDGDGENPDLSSNGSGFEKPQLIP